jgi:hypothetical protein
MVSHSYRSQSGTRVVNLHKSASPLRKVIGEALSVQVRFRFSRKAAAAVAEVSSPV